MCLFETLRVSPHIPAMKFFAFSQATCRTSIFAGIVTPSCLACVQIPGCFFFLRSIHLCSFLQKSIVSNTQSGSDASRKSSNPPVNLHILDRQGAFMLLALRGVWPAPSARLPLLPMLSLSLDSNTRHKMKSADA
jgi:hypothetical protein